MGSKERGATPPVVTMEDELDVHINVFSIAVKYDSGQLIAYSIKKLRAVLLDELQNNDPIWYLADRLAEAE